MMTNKTNEPDNVSKGDMTGWNCVSCGTRNKNNHNVGITNSGTDKTQCIKCYNAGIPAELI